MFVLSESNSVGATSCNGKNVITGVDASLNCASSNAPCSLLVAFAHVIGATPFQGRVGAVAYLQCTTWLPGTILEGDSDGPDIVIRYDHADSSAGPRTSCEPTSRKVKPSRPTVIKWTHSPRRISDLAMLASTEGVTPGPFDTSAPANALAYKPAAVSSAALALAEGAGSPVAANS